MTENEKQSLKALIEKGITVEVVNPFADKFNEKYCAYQKFTAPLRVGSNKKVVVLDENGNIIAQQG